MVCFVQNGIVYCHNFVAASLADRESLGELSSYGFYQMGSP